MKYTKHLLQKIEALLEDQGYVVRYEKGNFQSGYCLVENRKIAVINKFFDVEARINTLLDIMSRVELVPELFSEKNRQLYEKLQKRESVEDGEEQVVEEAAAAEGQDQ